MISVLCGCSAKEIAAAPTETELQTESTCSTADGYELLDALWSPGGIYVDGKLIDLNDNETIAGMYDANYLTFSGDGTFEFIEYFGERGTYSRYEKGRSGFTCFLLHTDECYTTSFENGEIVKVPNENTEKRTYLIEIPCDDENTMIVVDRRSRRRR